MSGEKTQAETGIDFSADDLMPPMPSPPGGEAVVGPPGGEAGIGVEQFKAIVEALQDELEKKTAEAADKHDAFMRAVAETENVRRRFEKEKDETAKYQQVHQRHLVGRRQFPACHFGRTARSSGQRPSAQKFP
jgi:hypothetical protein